jgi:hypothetical protein
MSKGKKEFTVVCYMRVNPEKITPLTYKEAISELNQSTHDSIYINK